MNRTSTVDLNRDASRKFSEGRSRTLIRTDQLRGERQHALDRRSTTPEAVSGIYARDLDNAEGRASVGYIAAAKSPLRYEGRTGWAALKSAPQVLALPGASADVAASLRPAAGAAKCVPLARRKKLV